MPKYRLRLKKATYGEAILKAPTIEEAIKKFNNDEPLEYFEDYSENVTNSNKWQIEGFEVYNKETDEFEEIVG